MAFPNRFAREAKGQAVVSSRSGSRTPDSCDLLEFLGVVVAA